ncbi:MAG: DNA repair protein RecN [Clostridia bacterium]|nr:DNA repair protein RecN [Clostridia bacterium]
MITTLHIKNVGIIEDLTVNFNEGLNILTGETGAGKTLIIGSIGIIAGGRFSKEMIRKGETFSFIEANIYCPQNPLAIDDNIIVSREIHSNGRSSSKVNGRLVTVNELKEIMEKIIDLHGQHDNQLLLNPLEHIFYLDQFIGIQMQEEKENYQKFYQEYLEINQKLKENYGDEQEKARKLDLLTYQFNEIEGAKLKLGEEEELENQKKVMNNAEKLQNSMKTIDEELNENVIAGISNSIRNLEKIEDCGKIYSEKLAQLKSIYYDIQEMARDFSDMKEQTYFDEQSQNEIENRLDLVYSLKRKYGNSIEAILEYQNSISAEIAKIQNLDEVNKKLTQKLQEVKTQMKEIGKSINLKRKEYGEKLSKEVNKELANLEMLNAKFSVNICYQEENFNINGLDKIEFFICTNIGEEAKPLVKIASGGEMSRIMLAIKTVLAKVDKVSTLVFDEIDTGMSGKASKAVGEKLKEISKIRQVLCITHSASIAAKGDYNYYISKKIEGEKTYTDIQELSEEQIIEEIARIASGDVTKIAKEHAKELRKAS